MNKLHPILIVGIIFLIGMLAMALSAKNHAGAKTIKVTGIEIVQELEIANTTRMYKVYDHDNRTVCYITNKIAWEAGTGISCLPGQE